jgi:hypothetical protein
MNYRSYAEAMNYIGGHGDVTYDDAPEGSSTGGMDDVLEVSVIGSAEDVVGGANEITNINSFLRQFGAPKKVKGRAEDGDADDGDADDDDMESPVLDVSDVSDVPADDGDDVLSENPIFGNDEPELERPNDDDEIIGIGGSEMPTESDATVFEEPDIFIINEKPEELTGANEFDDSEFDPITTDACDELPMNPISSEATDNVNTADTATPLLGGSEEFAEANKVLDQYAKYIQ